MRVCSYTHGGRRGVGTVEAGAVIPRAADDVQDLLLGAPGAPVGDPIPLSDVVLEAPVAPRLLIGIGLNYRDHAAETGKDLPSFPLLFSKLPSSVTRPSGPVVRPGYTGELDYEGELAVVIGREARDVAERDAPDHVAGYTIIDDISARDRQRQEPQWVRAKGGDGFAPTGPWVTTPDEVGDPQALRIVTSVNGEVRQDGTTADMAFSVVELVSWCSRQFTLGPGDVIATGTPAGVGLGMRPPRFLQPGDVVRVEIERLGWIEHPICAPGA